MYVTAIGLNYLFPATMAYIQLSTTNSSREPSPYPWARLNHTLVITRSTVESFLEVTAVLEPRPSPTNITVNIAFGPETFATDAYLVPVVTGGDLVWSGELHQGSSLTLRTTLSMPSDGRYFFGGGAGSSDSTGTMGAGTGFFLLVQYGIVTSVSKTIAAEPGEIEVRCLNC